MLDISLEQVYPWLEEKYEEKYRQKFEPLKMTFLTFYNLAHQIIGIYNYILEETTSQQQQFKYRGQSSLRLIIERTIVILEKLVENEKLLKNRPGSIDMNYCEKFIKNFSENLNILCTYYHSLNHCEQVQDSFRFQKKKIVEGINKLYTIHNCIKDLYFKNQLDLTNIEHHKIYTLINIKRIITDKEALVKNSKLIYFSIQDYLADFYEHFQEIIKFGKSASTADQEGSQSDNAEQTIKKLMRNYFRILHQFSQSQAELQYYLKPIINYCEQLRTKKKQQLNFAIADSINNFTRITSQLLKTNFSFKNHKKIRVEDLNKALVIILEDILYNWAEVYTGANGIEFKENAEMLGHKLFKQLGIGLLRKPEFRQNRAYNNNVQKPKQSEKGQKQKNKQKQKLQKYQKSSTQTQKSSSKSKNSKQKSEYMAERDEKVNSSSNQNKQQQLLEKQVEEEEEADKMDREVAEASKEESKRKIFEDDEDNYDNPQYRINEVAQEICQCAYFILDCMKELEKVESSGLMNMIQQYKQKIGISSTSSEGNQSQQYQGMNKLISKLCEYQKYINNYYRLHESIKQFQKIMKQLILQQFKIKVNINVCLDFESHINSGTGSSSSKIAQKNKNNADEQDKKIKG